MMMVLVIFPAEMTLPVRIRPRIETSPVKGHFLSVLASEGGLSRREKEFQERRRMGR